jgi:hypothetical protein
MRYPIKRLSKFSSETLALRPLRMIYDRHEDIAVTPKRVRHRLLMTE